jgi:adenine-specific DNA-methyltransferase
VTEGEDAYTVELREVDVYDPVENIVRSSGPEDAMAWFIDTNYDENQFFVRHAYFTGDSDPYAQLKRALNAEIDHEAWSRLHSTVSLPFDRPDTGKIAVKVINHYGDEVLKVFKV